MRGFEFLKLKIQINFLGVRLPRFLLLYWSVLLGSQRYVQQKKKKYCALTVTLFLCFSISSAQVDFCPETCSGVLYCLYFMVPCHGVSLPVIDFVWKFSTWTVKKLTFPLTVSKITGWDLQEAAEDTTGGCTVTEASAVSLGITAQLLQLEKEELKAALCSR